MASDTRRAGHEPNDEGPPLARTVLAVSAGWLLPGLGHVVIGRARRGLLFATLIFGSFALGMLHDGRLALGDSRQPFLSTLQVIANLGIGPADTIARWAVYGEPAYLLRDTAYPRHATREGILRDRARSVHSIYGTAYLWTAGLMNLMALFDVRDLTTGRKT